MALACSCWHPDPKEYLSNTALIFKGTVLAVYSEIPNKALAAGVDPNSLKHYTKQRAKFKMNISYKGPALDEVEVSYTESYGGNCGWGFTVGKEIMVFAHGNIKDGFETGMCTMIPYASAVSNGDMSFQTALEAYQVQRETLAATLRKNPNNTESLLNQATFFLQYHDFDEAESAYQQLLKKSDQNVAGLVGLGDVKFNRALHQNDNNSIILYEQALADYRSALKIDPKDRVANHGETLALLKLGKVAELSKNIRDFSGIDNISDYSGNDKAAFSFAGRNLADANFRNAKLTGIDFSGANLRHADFTGAELNNCNFADATLTHAKFRHLKGSYNTSFASAKLNYADFTEANLEGSNFNKARLDGANFLRANLSRSILSNAKIHKAKFIDTSFAYANLEGLSFINQNLVNVTLYDTNLRNSKFVRTKLSVAENRLDSTDFSGSNLRQIDLSGMEIRDCKFTSAKLNHAKFRYSGMIANNQFNNAKLQNSDFSESYILRSKFQNTHLEEANFTNATIKQSFLDDALIDKAIFIGAKFPGTHIRRQAFRNHNLRKTDLRGADLRETSFQNTLLTHVEFGYSEGDGYTDLRGTDLSKTHLANAKWGKVLVDCRTKLPLGYELKDLPIFPLWSNCVGHPPKTKLAGESPSHGRFWLTRVDAQNSDLAELNLSNYIFDHVQFDGSDFSKSKLTQITIKSGSYLNTRFDQTNLRGAKLHNVKFPGGSFVRTDLTDVKLQNVDFSETNLIKAILTNLCFDKQTKWPPGYDPIAAGAKTCD